MISYRIYKKHVLFIKEQKRVKDFRLLTLFLSSNIKILAPNIDFRVLPEKKNHI